MAHCYKHRTFCGLFVYLCVLGTPVSPVSPEKTDEPTEMPFGGQTRMTTCYYFAHAVGLQVKMLR